MHHGWRIVAADFLKRPDVTTLWRVVLAQAGADDWTGAVWRDSRHGGWPKLRIIHPWSKPRLDARNST
jgi:hypothetical protein